MNNLLPFYDEERALDRQHHDDRKSAVNARHGERSVLLTLGACAVALPLVVYGFLTELVS